MWQRGAAPVDKAVLRKIQFYSISVPTVKRSQRSARVHLCPCFYCSAKHPPRIHPPFFLKPKRKQSSLTSALSSEAVPNLRCTRRPSAATYSRSTLRAELGCGMLSTSVWALFCSICITGWCAWAGGQAWT